MAALLVLGMVLGLVPARLNNAATIIGVVTVGTDRYEYDDLDDLVDDVEDFAGETIVIDMLADWQNERLCIPKESKTTFNMHGHMYNRGLTDDTHNGEVIWIGSDAVVTINGCSNSEENRIGHSVKYYHSAAQENNNADRSMSVYGGTIAGGYSSNGGGGIDIKANVTLTLNDVTIAGCRAEQSWGTDGYGGGIWVHGGTNEAGTLIMNRSTITGCYAYNDGGGLYQTNHDKFILEMHDSHIDYNYCYDDGAGICVDGESIMIIGDGRSSVSYNVNGGGSGSLGGGIFVWNDDVSISGLTIKGNKGGNGGGIYTVEETITIADCDISENYAWHKGGGVYVENDNTTISGCTIVGNSSQEAGGGVYVEDDVDTGFNVTGATEICGNSGGNLYLENDSRVNFTLTKGADVYMRFASMPSTFKMVTEGSVGDTKKTTNCIRYLHADQDGYHFTFNSAPNQRKIYLVKDGYTGTEVGSAFVPGNPTYVSAQEADEAARTPVSGYTVSGAYDGASREYPLYRGYYQFLTQVDPSSNSTAVFYYSDGYFDADPKVYNPHLATMSTTMTMAGMYLNRVDYPSKHAAARQILSDIGVDDQYIYVNDYNIQKPGKDTIGVTIGLKPMVDANGEATGKYILPVVVRGGNYEAEWASNMKIGRGDEKEGGEALGFSEAADQVYAEIEYYIEKYDLQSEIEAGNIKFWVVGFSRGGATANITSKRLVENYACGEEGKNNQVFAYCIEAPQGGTDNAEKLSEKSNYYCIHNVINYADIVPLVGPSDMGFKRYGVDHYVPGTDAGTVKSSSMVPQCVGSYSGITSVTTYADNEPILTKKNGGDNPDYVALRAKMLEQLASVDSNIIYDDYFHVMEMNFVPGISIEEVGTYAVCEEDFIRHFFQVFQSWAMPSRDDWANKSVILNGKAYVTMQDAMRSLCMIVFGLGAEQSEGFMTKAGTLTSKLSMASFSDVSMVDIYTKLIIGWANTSESTKDAYIQSLWSKLESTGALEYLSAADRESLKVAWPTLAVKIFSFVSADYWHSYVPADSDANVVFIGTFAGNASRILMNHYPEVDVSWFRAMDSFYNGVEFDERNKEYEVGKSSSLEKPIGYIEVSDEETLVLEPYQWYTLLGDQKLMLDVTDTHGEAIYYQLEKDGVMSEEKIYKGGIILPVGENDTSATYRVWTYARSHEAKSGETWFLVKAVGNNHAVNVTGKTLSDGQIQTYTEDTVYALAGETVHVALRDVPQEKFFMGWKVMDERGNNVTAKIIPEEDKRKETELDFVMPEADGSAFALDYSLYFEAQYGEYVHKIDLETSVTAYNQGNGMPVAGLPLADDVLVRWNGSTEAMDFTTTDRRWEFEYDDNGTSVMVHCYGRDLAFSNTKYTYSFKVKKTDDIRFADDLEVHMDGVEDSKLLWSIDPKDGGVLVTVFFDATGEGGEPVPEENIHTLRIVPYDKNQPDTPISDYIQEYRVIGRMSASFSLPDIPGMQFDGYGEMEGTSNVSYDLVQGWVRFESDASAECVISVLYAPVIHRIEIVYGDDKDWRPQAWAEATESISHVYVTARETYEIENVLLSSGSDRRLFQTSWTPSLKVDHSTQGNPYRYEYYTAYEMAVTFMGKTTGDETYDAVKVTFDGDQVIEGEHVQVGNKYVIADDCEVIINGLTADLYHGYKATVLFPRTEASDVFLLSVTQPEDVYDVPHNTSTETLYRSLPAKVPIEVSDGSVNEAKVSWSSLYAEEGYSDSPGMDETVYYSIGKIILPDGVSNVSDYPMQIKVRFYVNAADAVAAPTAVAHYDAAGACIHVELFSETEGAQMFYTTDGRDAYYGDIYQDEFGITITQDMLDQNGGQVFIRAIAWKNDMFNSSESIFVYRFAEAIIIPEGFELTYNGMPQIGVAGSAYYILEGGEGVTIDEEGNALATQPGTYTVTAKIKDGYVWDTGEKQPIDLSGISSSGAQADPSIVQPANVGENTEATEPVTTTEDQTITFTILSAEAPEPVFKTQSIILSGRIGINFFMDLKEFEGVDYSDSFMTFDITGKGTITAKSDYDAEFKSGDGLYYGFTCYVNSIQMADTITATYHYKVNGEEKMVEKTYSVREYIEAFDAEVESHPGQYTEETIALVHSLADYGHYVQPFLSRYRHWRLGTDYASADYMAMDRFYTGTQADAGTCVYDTDAIKTAVADYALVCDDENNADVKSMTYSLILESETAVNLYFTMNDPGGTTFAAEVTYVNENGETVTVPLNDEANGTSSSVTEGLRATLTKRADGRFCLSIAGIRAQDLDQMFTVTVTTTNGTETIAVSGLSYVDGMLGAYTSDSEADIEARNAAGAVYWYWKAAQDFVG